MSNTHSTAELVHINAASRVSVVSYVPHDFLDYLDQLHGQSVEVHKQAQGLNQMFVNENVYGLRVYPHGYRPYN